jgi:putative oxidoreductase
MSAGLAMFRGSLDVRVTRPRRSIHRRALILILSCSSGIGPLFTLIISLLVRLTLVALFLPFSALDKLLNATAAVDQAQRTAHSRVLARVLIALGLLVEVVMSLAVIAGFFDRLAAVILAGYCMVTAVLWKQFWKTDDFRLKGPSKGREVFWDFLKNFALAGGFLILATGGTALGVQEFMRYPSSSSHPYATEPLLPVTHAANPSAGARP